MESSSSSPSSSFIVPSRQRTRAEKFAAILEIGNRVTTHAEFMHFSQEVLPVMLHDFFNAEESTEAESHAASETSELEENRIMNQLLGIYTYMKKQPGFVMSTTDDAIAVLKKFWEIMSPNLETRRSFWNIQSVSVYIITGYVTERGAIYALLNTNFEIFLRIFSFLYPDVLNESGRALPVPEGLTAPLTKFFDKAASPIFDNDNAESMQFLVETFPTLYEDYSAMLYIACMRCSAKIMRYFFDSGLKIDELVRVAFLDHHERRDHIDILRRMCQQSYGDEYGAIKLFIERTGIIVSHDLACELFEYSLENDSVRAARVFAELYDDVVPREHSRQEEIIERCVTFQYPSMTYIVFNCGLVRHEYLVAKKEQIIMHLCIFTEMEKFDAVIQRLKSYPGYLTPETFSGMFMSAAFEYNNYVLSRHLVENYAVDFAAVCRTLDRSRRTEAMECGDEIALWLNSIVPDDIPKFTTARERMTCAPSPAPVSTEDTFFPSRPPSPWG